MAAWAAAEVAGGCSGGFCCCCCCCCCFAAVVVCCCCCFAVVVAVLLLLLLFCCCCGCFAVVAVIIIIVGAGRPSVEFGAGAGRQVSNSVLVLVGHVPNSVLPPAWCRCSCLKAPLLLLLSARSVSDPAAGSLTLNYGQKCPYWRGDGNTFAPVFHKKF